MQGNSEQLSLHEYLQTLMDGSTRVSYSVQESLQKYEIAIFMPDFGNSKLLNLL